jgi:hypothetical protein
VLDLKEKARGRPWPFDFYALEAPIRFELMMEVLQTSALPLGDGALITSFLLVPKARLELARPYSH